MSSCYQPQDIMYSLQIFQTVLLIILLALQIIATLPKIEEAIK